jgi:RNA polymerase sigma-70 factor (ECF subfamily)
MMAESSSMISAPGEVTSLLRDAGQGDQQAARRLFPLVYDELRQIAGRYMSSEQPGHTLQPTAIVHEAYLRLVGREETYWQCRSQFFAVAARAMRCILIDHLRRKRAARRGGDRRREPLSESLVVPGARGYGSLRVDDRDEYMLALDGALDKLAQIDPQACRVVELRFFGGLTVEETADLLRISPRTVKREWQYARAWLHHQIIESER